MNKIGNCCRTQRKDAPPEIIKLPIIHPTDDGRKAVSRPEANVGSQNDREGSITTDDSVCRHMIEPYALPDLS